MGLSGGGINPCGAWAITSGGANTAGISGPNPASVVLRVPFIVASCVLLVKGWGGSFGSRWSSPGSPCRSPSRSRGRYRFPAGLVLRTSLTVSCILVPGRQDLERQPCGVRTGCCQLGGQRHDDCVRARHLFSLPFTFRVRPIARPRRTGSPATCEVGRH